MKEEKARRELSVFCNERTANWWFPSNGGPAQIQAKPEHELDIKAEALRLGFRVWNDWYPVVEEGVTMRQLDLVWPSVYERLAEIKP